MGKDNVAFAGRSITGGTLCVSLHGSVRDITMKSRVTSEVTMKLHAFFCGDDRHVN
jgi:hypothetical protein